VKRQLTIEKYEQTYGRDFSELISLSGNRHDFERIITSKIIELLKNINKILYIASFPFFNSRNVVVYNLIHCTGSLVGFKLFKKTVWQIFGGRSSLKDTHGKENQLAFVLDGSSTIETIVDEDCYHVMDIATYIQKHFRGKDNVPLANIWKLLDNHPIFPSEGFRNEIKKILKQVYGCKESKGTLTFSDEG